MKKITYLICTLFILSCAKEPKTNFEIPVLLERSEKMQYFNEWSEVRTSYSDLKHLLTKNPDHIDALIRITNLFIAEARITGEHGHYYPAALKTIEQALQQKNINKDQEFLALSAKASVQLSLHHFKDALKTAEIAQQKNPYNALIYGALIDAHVELGDYKNAVSLADKMVSMRPDLRSYSRVSYLREIYGMPEDAIKAMQMAVEAGSPGSEEKAWAALQLAQLCIRYNKTAEGISILNQILEERPDYPFAKANLATVYMSQGKFKEAEQELKEACAIIPEVSFYIHLAELYKQTKQQEAFDKLLPEILDMLTDDTQHGHNMSLEFAAVYSELLNDPDKALNYIQEDLNMRPENIDINRSLANIYLLKKDKEMAANFLLKANSTNSKNPELLELNQRLQKI
ncbi:MAG: tetratricopeptide repeat protein [Saprospiraceae bacterium]|nr:tetratricopeptide repeat protein [Saprospiraceae bacterium]MBK7738269.1 tetratricopeptide repeat protein [Saprospiraceae bacterium]MBK7913157.1 tetratricopeptide repeat protein [Saprospiraceae bacterium]